MSAPCGMNYQCPANKLDVSLCQGIVFTECCLFSNKKKSHFNREVIHCSILQVCLSRAGAGVIIIMLGF